MILETLRSRAGADEAAGLALGAMPELFPLCRSITGDGVRRTLDLLERWIPLARHEVPSGTPVFDWEVPAEWNVRDAWVADASGRRVIDFRANTLHLLNYSVPVRRTMTLDGLQPHLHSLPERPDLIPYRTSYYKEQWGFCLRHRDREQLGAGPFEVVVDSTLAPGHLSYAECVVPGRSEQEAIVYTHTCHPALANDNLSGIMACTLLARALRAETPRLTWRFVFGPGTIGSLTWLARNEHRLGRIAGGLVLGLLGDKGPLTYKRSRRGDTATDRAAGLVLAGTAARIVDFEPYGYDERQFCSPGIDLAVGRLTRSPNGAYPEYHTSADDIALLDPACYAESIRTAAELIAHLDANRWPRNLAGKGEPRLGKRGLYGSVGGHAPGEFEHALLWVLSMGDGTRDLFGIAARSGLSFELIEKAASALENVQLVRSAATREPGEGTRA